MKRESTYVFAGGGTGGHLFPGLAVAHALRQIDPNARIVFLTTDRPLDQKLLERTDFEQRPQPVRPLTMHPLKLPAFLLAWRRSVGQAKQFLREAQPRAVLGLGGYAAGPPVVAAHKLGIRAGILNPDATPGRANRYLSKCADLVVMQWDVSRKYFGANAHCETLGCPIRAEFSGPLPADAAATFGLDPNKRTLLVTGASQGARSINETMQRIWPRFAREYADWQLLHLTGATDEAETRAAYERADVEAKVLAFTHEMASAIAAADAVISRAGASTLAELTALGRPSILLPYPYHRDKHQHSNAQVLVDAGAAILVEDMKNADQNEGPLSTALQRLADADVRAKMSQAAEKLARPDAAQQVAKWLARN